MSNRGVRWGTFASMLAVVALLFQSYVPLSTTEAGYGTTLFYLEGTSKSYKDTTPSSSDVLSGTAQFSSLGRAFGLRLVTTVPKTFPYGVYGLDETDQDGDMNYLDSGDVDPLKLMDAIQSDGVYNYALSTKLGSIVNEEKIIRTLEGAKARNLKLLVRVLRYDKDAGFGLGPNDIADTEARLQRFKSILTKRADLAPTIYAWYSYDEPLNKKVSLTDLEKAYNLHKKYFPNTSAVPRVFTVFNQVQNISSTCPDSNGNGISDCMLGEPKNRYSSSTGDIIGLNIYNAVSTATTSTYDPSRGNYGYNAIRTLYHHARKKTGTKPVWAVAQAHALVGDPTNRPEPHQLYREVNDWLHAGAEISRPLNGFLWYSWHFPPGSVQDASDLEGDSRNRAMAKAIGEQIRTNGSLVTHKLPYRSELYLPATLPSSSYIMKAPRAGHFNLSAGTITLSFTHLWGGNDGVRHVLFDTGVSSTKNRLVIEKTGDNTLRLVVVDSLGRAKWTGLKVNQRNMPGSLNLPGYSEIIATWSNGALAVYLDGVKGTLGGAASGATGTLSSGGTYIYIGSDMSGRYGANGTFSYLTVRSGVLSSTEAASFGRIAVLK